MKRVVEKGAPTPGITRGYLYVAERKKGAVGSWVRHYMEYHEEGDELHLYSINPVCFKGHVSDKDLLKVRRESCTRCRTDEVERRFCFEVVSGDKRIFLLQADSPVSISPIIQWIQAIRTYSYTGAVYTISLCGVIT